MLERINLVPQRPLAERIRMATLPVVGALLALIILFLATSDKLLQRKIKAMDREIATAQKFTDELAVFQAKANALEKEVGKEKEAIAHLSTSAARFTGIEQRKRFFSAPLAAITAAMPGSVRCQKIIFQKDGGLINGTAKGYRDPSDFFSKLAENPLFTVVTLEDMDQPPGAEKTGFTFTIAFQLKKGS